MKAMLCSMAVALLFASPAMAGGGGTGGALGAAAGAWPDAQMKWLCVEALKRELAGGPPAPIACQADARPLTVQQPPRPLRCETHSYYRINGVPQYTTTCN